MDNTFLVAIPWAGEYILGYALEEEPDLEVIGFVKKTRILPNEPKLDVVMGRGSLDGIIDLLGVQIKLPLIRPESILDYVLPDEYYFKEMQNTARNHPILQRFNPGSYLKTVGNVYRPRVIQIMKESGVHILEKLHKTFIWLN